MKSKIIGCGSYLPSKILSNRDIELLVDTADEWITSRTGITKRHIAAEDEYTSHLALKAAQNAIKDANLQPKDIDLIIVSTTTPDHSFPSTATKLQGYLGLKNVPSFDLQAVCSGFVYGIEVANAFISSGKYNTILLVCAEKMSSLVDWSDRSTCVLFGDGAGAVIIQKNGNDDNSGIIDSLIYSDGTYLDLLYTDGGVSSNGKSGHIKMQGQVLYKHAVEKMTQAVIEIMSKNNINVDDIAHFIPHQANIRILNAVAERLKFDQSKMTTTITEHANCSAASIPLALAQLKMSGMLSKGDIVLFTAFGAGLTWGSTLIRW